MKLHRKNKCIGDSNPAAKTAGIYKITYPDGSTKIIKNLRKFCRENNFDRGSMYRICNGKKKSPYKGYWVDRLDYSHQQKIEMSKSVNQHS